jgi:hypothetical protein
MTHTRHIERADQPERETGYGSVSEFIEAVLGYPLDPGQREILNSLPVSVRELDRSIAPQVAHAVRKRLLVDLGRHWGDWPNFVAIARRLGAVGSYYGLLYQLDVAGESSILIRADIVAQSPALREFSGAWTPADLGLTRQQAERVIAGVDPALPGSDRTVAWVRPNAENLAAYQRSLEEYVRNRSVAPIRDPVAVPAPPRHTVVDEETAIQGATLDDSMRTRRRVQGRWIIADKPATEDDPA